MMKKLLIFLGGQSSLGEKGGEEWAPPSTLPTLKRALELGIDLEIDLRMTKDKEIVVFHDARLEKRSNGGGYVIDKTLRKLKELDAGSWFHPKFKSLKILTFKELLSLFKEYNKESIMDAHLKETMAGYEDKAVDLVKEYRVTGGVQFHSYSHSPHLAKRVKEANPELKVGLDCLEEYIYNPSRAIESFSWVDFVLVHEESELFWINKELISEIHNRNKKVYVLKPSFPLRWKQLIDMGVDGINCYSPLEAKKYWRDK